MGVAVLWGRRAVQHHPAPWVIRDRLKTLVLRNKVKPVDHLSRLQESDGQVLASVSGATLEFLLAAKALVPGEPWHPRQEFKAARSICGVLS